MNQNNQFSNGLITGVAITSIVIALIFGGIYVWSYIYG